VAKRQKPVDPCAKLLKAAFEAAIRDGWRGLRIAELAKRAGITVAEAYRIAPDRPSLLDSYFEAIDARTLEALSDEEADGETWQDVAFDALMLRFDAMLKDRDALRVIYFDDARDLVALARAAQRTRRSLERILEASGFAEDALGVRIGAIAFLPLYARVFRTWLNDEVDQARTMAALDKALGRLDGLKGRVTRSRGRDQAEAEEEPGEARDHPPTNGSAH
jgi:AcrR family transcriptional regulator